jgi:hypothetical protein
MDDQGDDCDDKENVYQAPRDVECEPPKDPSEKKDDEEDQEQ